MSKYTTAKTVAAIVPTAGTAGAPNDRRLRGRLPAASRRVPRYPRRHTRPKLRTRVQALAATRPFSTDGDDKEVKLGNAAAPFIPAARIGSQRSCAVVPIRAHARPACRPELLGHTRGRAG